MAKRTKTNGSKKPAKATGKHGGPFLAAAFFCENILEDKDGSLTAVRIIDGSGVGISGDAPPDFPSKEKPFAVEHWALMAFKSGDSPGKHLVKFVMENPSGKRTPGLEKEITLSEQPYGGMNIRTPVRFLVYETGLFWLDVYLDGKRLTRMPFNVTITRQQPAAKPAKSTAVKPNS